MKTIRERKLFEKLGKRKNRIHFLKGVGQIILPRIYSFSQKGNGIHLLCDGEEIHCFHKGVTVQSIKDYVSSYKVLRDYCKAPVSACHQFKNCDSCNSLHKKWAEEREYIGDKIVKPSIKDISEERTSLSPIRSKKISSGRFHSWKW